MTTYNLQGISPVSRRINQSGGVPKKRVVVMGAGDREVALPGGANAAAVEGVALEGGDNGAHIPVQTDGDAICIASAAIGRGVRVNVTGTSGKVKAVSETGATVNVVGVTRSAATADNDEIIVRLTVGETLNVA